MCDAMLYIVRHGLTEANLRYDLIGRADPPLHSLGRAQAAALGEALKECEFPTIYTSPKRRAAQTAAAIAAARTREAAVVEVANLREIDLGLVDGMSSFTAYDIHRDAMDQALAPDAPDEFCFPGGERRLDALVRFEAAVREIAQAGGAACMVTHGGVLGLWLARLHHQPLALFRAWQPPHGSLTQVHVNNEGTVRVIAFGDTSHIPPSLIRDIGCARDSQNG